MLNNLMCPCGKPAQIACKCFSNLNFFCFTHLEQHMLNDPDNHIPLALAHALSMQDPESKSRNIQLDKIEMNLLKYQKELENHISGLNSLHKNMKEVIDHLFEPYFTKYSKILKDVKELRNNVEWCKVKNLEQAKCIIEKYKSTKIRGILTSFEEISDNTIDIFQSLLIEFGFGRYFKSPDRDNREVRDEIQFISVDNQPLIRIQNPVKESLMSHVINLPIQTSNPARNSERLTVKDPLISTAIVHPIQTSNPTQNSERLTVKDPIISSAIILPIKTSNPAQNSERPTVKDALVSTSIINPIQTSNPAQNSAKLTVKDSLLSRVINLPNNQASNPAEYPYQYPIQNQPAATPKVNYSEEHEVMNMLAMDPLFRKCPAEKCFYVIYNENKSLVLDCPRCNKSYCLNCSKTCHPGLTCSEARGNAPPQYLKYNPLTSNPAGTPVMYQSKRIDNCRICGDYLIDNTVTLNCGDIFHRMCIVRHAMALLSNNCYPRCLCNQSISRQELKELIK